MNEQVSRKPSAGTSIIASFVALICIVVMYFARTEWYFPVVAVALTALSFIKHVAIIRPYIGKDVKASEAYLVMSIAVIVATIIAFICKCNPVIIVAGVFALVNIVLSIMTVAKCGRVTDTDIDEEDK